jgi:hypothetical protein
MTRLNSGENVWAAESAELVAIATDGTWAHAADDLATLAADVATARGPVDVFDRSGNRYTPVFDDDGRLRDLEKIPGAAANPGLVRERLVEVVRHVRQWLRNRGEPTDLVPSVDGFITGAAISLGAVLGAFYLSPDNRGGHVHNPGDFWHNALHRAGWNHD